MSVRWSSTPEEDAEAWAALGRALRRWWARYGVRNVRLTWHGWSRDDDRRPPVNRNRW